VGVPTYNDLLNIVAFFTENEDTLKRNAIPASKRLSETLRIVSARQAFDDMKFTSARAPQTLCGIFLLFIFPP
jgi:hypothetical protein